MSRYLHSAHQLSDGHRKYENPLFPKQHPSRWRAVRVFLLVLALLGVAAYSWMAFGPWFRIDYVIVEGNSFITTAKVQTAVEQYMERRAFWVLPQNTYVAFSNEAAQKFLQQELQHTRALESLQVKKAIPASVTVVLQERVPHLVYSNGGQLFLMDRNAVITEAVPVESKLNPAFPTLLDQTTRSIAVNQQIWTGEAIEFLFTAHEALQKTDITIETYYLPPVSCFTPTIVDFRKRIPEEQTVNTNEPITTNDTSNSNRTNTARSNSSFSNSPANSNSTSLRNALNTNGLLTNEEEGTAETCNLADQVRRSRELRIRTKEQWDIYLRYDDSFDRQLTRLLRTLREKNLDRAKLAYVDLRFGEEVAYKYR